MRQLYKSTVGVLLFNSFILSSNTILAQTTFQIQPIGQSLETYGASWGDVNADGYTDLIYSNHRVAPTLYLNNGDGTFSDRTDLIVGANNGADMHGVSWVDIDNDGDQDLYVQVGGSKAHRKNQQGELYINNGNNLVRQNGHELVYGEHRGRVSLWFDADADGDLDVAMMGYPPPANISGQSAMFTQNVNAVFNKNSGTYGFSCNSTLKFGLLTDLTRNGTLDLVCGGPGFPTKIYQTDSVPFKNKTNIVGPRFSSVVDAVSADFDGDQDNDVVVVRRRSKPANAIKLDNKTVKAIAVVNPGEKGTNLTTTGNLNLTFATDFLNNKINFGASKNHLNLQPNPNTPGKVYNVVLNANNTDLHGLGAYNPGNGISANEAGIYIGYFPAAGEWRIRVVSNKWSRFEYLAVSTTNITNVDHIGYNPNNDDLTLKYLFNNGASGFIDRTNQVGLNVPMTARSAVAADFDNDADTDIFVVCEHEPEQCDHFLFENDGTGNFTSTRIPHGANGLSESAVIADYDLDGCIDIATANGWFNAVYGESDHLLYRNNCTNGNNALEFDLVGVSSNRDGIGAKVEVTTFGTGGKTQFRELGNMHHRFSQNDKRLHFGLGQKGSADVKIHWPNGQVDQYPGVVAGSLYKATEADSLEVVQALSADVTPRLFVSDVTVDESDLSAQVTISLVPANNNDIVSVDYNTQNGSAVSPDDYGADSGPVDFLIGETQKSITISIVDDADAEPTEEFEIKLSNPGNAGLADDTGVITIRDDDNTNTGSECGKPNFSKANEIGVFMWRDCTNNSSQAWRMRTTGGRSTSLIQYDGLITSDTNFNSVTGINLEPAHDTLDDSDPQQISYIFKMVNNGIDGVNFHFNAGANVCFDPTALPSGALVYVGSGRNQISGAFNLQNLGACQ